MAYTTPTTQTSGALITAATWNAEIVENIKYLKGSPVFDGDVAASGNISTDQSVFVANGAGFKWGDGSTYISGSSSTDALSLATNGATRVTIPSAGGVTVETVAPATPVAATLYKDSLVSAWCAVTFSGGTPSIDDDFNVASLTDNGTGDTTVTYATAIGVSSYAAVASPRANSNRLHASCYSFASGSVRVYTYNDAADIAADSDFSMVAVGA